LKIALYHNLPSGGGLYHFSQVAHGLKAAGHELHLYCPQTAEMEFSSLGSVVDSVTVLERKPWAEGFFLWNPWRYRTYLEQCMAEERVWAELIAHSPYEGIYVGQCRTWTEPPLLRFLPRDFPKVLYCQEPKRTFYEERFLKQMAAWPWWKKLWRGPTVHWMKVQMGLNIACANLVLCNSNFSKTRIEKAYESLKAEVSSIGVDTQIFAPNATTPVLNQIITVGALDPSKNHGFALEVAALKPTGQALKVIVVTDRSYGHTADQLRAQAQALGVELIIRERVSTEDLAELYRSSLATVYAPIEEPFGIVSIESQACGTPVIGVREGGLLETIRDGVGGYLVDRSAQVAAQKCASLLNDPLLRQKLSTQARQHVLEHWDKTQKIKATVSLLEGAFGRKGI
jgi:glycosyltransferase involved in cell wall biosynthesis